MNDIVQNKEKEYWEHFGEPYVFVCGFPKSTRDIVEEIDTCIRENKRQVIPEYEDHLIYEREIIAGEESIR